MHVSYELAQQIVDKAVEKSKQMGVKMCIAILDSGGNLKSFTRMDDARVGSIDIAIKKAKTACHFAMPSGAIGVSGDSAENDHILAQAGVDVAGVCNMPKHPWRT